KDEIALRNLIDSSLLYSSTRARGYFVAQCLELSGHCLVRKKHLIRLRLHQSCLYAPVFEKLLLQMSLLIGGGSELDCAPSVENPSRHDARAPLEERSASRATSSKMPQHVVWRCSNRHRHRQQQMPSSERPQHPVRTPLHFWQEPRP